MSAKITSLSPKKLKSLMNGPTVCVQYKATATSEYRILHNTFPRNVAIAFSGAWSTLFPPTHKLATRQTQIEPQKTLTLIGGDPASHVENLRWMISCCRDKGMQYFHRIDEKPFYSYFFLKESATIIDCKHLENIFKERMKLLAGRQIHSKDVRVLCQRLPAGHQMLDFLAEHVARLTWKNELKARPAYYTLREEFPNLNTAINLILDTLSEELRAKRKAERVEYYQTLREEARHNRRNQSAANQKGEKKEPRPKDVKPAAEQSIDCGVKEVDELRTESETSNTKRVVPGADNYSQTPQYKNKAARRRHKRREAKNAVVSE